MPILDKPLEELKVYQGRNPRPDDVDEFWDASLAEMHALDAQVELEPAEFQAPGAECFHLWFTGMGGARVHAKYIRPKGAGEAGGGAAGAKLPAVVFFHGYSGDSGSWSSKLGYVGQGFCTAALDCRGQAGLSEDTGGVRGNTLHGHIIRGLFECDPKKLYYRNVFLDTAQLARIVMSFEEVDAARVGATGGSQGGGLTLACASLEPGIRRAAPLYPFLCDYRRVWEMDLAKHAYQELATYFKSFDPTHEREDEMFALLGYIDCQHLAHRIEAEVMMATALLDDVCPPSTQFAAYNKIASKKNMVIYPDFGHAAPWMHEDKVMQFMLGL